MPARFRDAIVSAGERAAVPLVAAAFRQAGHEAVALDAVSFVRTDDTFGEAAVDFETTGRLVRAALADVPAEAVAVVTGFVASTEDGVTTTLGRSGSDYTATILAGALDAAECVIWTDVDGVLSADPRVVPEAFSLARLSYEEAAELAHFGAKVLHPRTMRPLQRAGIPLRIKNTLRPEAPGTLVGPAEPNPQPSIRAVTAVRDAALVRVDGAATLEVPDLARRIFGPLAEAGVAVSLVAQASAEGSFGLAVRQHDAEAVVALLRRALAREIERGDVRAVRAEPGGAVVAAVGSGMHGAAGLAGRFFATLARAHVNARAVAQGGGDHTISAVVADADAVRAVRALHEAFALNRLRRTSSSSGPGRSGAASSPSSTGSGPGSSTRASTSCWRGSPTAGASSGTRTGWAATPPANSKTGSRPTWTPSPRALPSRASSASLSSTRPPAPPSPPATPAGSGPASAS